MFFWITIFSPRNVILISLEHAYTNGTSLDKLLWVPECHFTSPPGAKLHFIFLTHVKLFRDCRSEGTENILPNAPGIPIRTHQECFAEGTSTPPEGTKIVLQKAPRTYSPTHPKYLQNASGVLCRKHVDSPRRHQDCPSEGTENIFSNAPGIPIRTL